MMKFNSIYHSIPGRRHLSMGKENEDFVNVYESDTVVILAVADGCSESSCASSASKATVAAAIELAVNGDIWEMKQKAIRNEFLRVLDKHYLNCPYPYEDLAATTALIVINKVNNRFLAISIGDCSCVILSKSLEPALLLQPLNLMRQRDRTVFANSSLASRSMRMETGVLDDVGGFVLITDGADALLEQECIPDIQQLTSLVVLSPKQAQAGLQTYINKLADQTSDDITIAITMRSDDPDIIRIAGATYASELVLGEDQDTPIEVEYATAIDDSGDAGTPALLRFLETPRTAEELLLSGYIDKEVEILTFLTPLLRNGLITYEDHRFIATKGG